MDMLVPVLNKEMNLLSEHMKTIRNGKFVKRIFDDKGKLSFKIEEYKNEVINSAPHLLELITLLVTPESYREGEILKSEFMLKVNHLVFLVDRDNPNKFEQVVSVIDLLMKIKAGSMTTASPITDATTTCLKLAQTPNSMIDMLCRQGKSHSSSLTREMKNEMVQQHKIAVETFLNDMKESQNSVGLAISDNYNPSQMMRLQQGRWRRISSLNTLLKQLEPVDNLDFQHNQTLSQVNKDSLNELIMKLESSYLIDEDFLEMKLPVDTRLPTMYTFLANELIEARSSSKEEVHEKLLNGLMHDSLRTHIKPSVLVVDPEPFNLLITIIRESPDMICDGLKFLLPMIGIFHLRKHFMEGTLIDHQNYLYFFHHVLEVFHHEPSHERNELDVLKQLLDRIDIKKLSREKKKEVAYLRSNLLYDGKTDGKTDDDKADHFFPDVGEVRGDKDVDKFVLISHLFQYLEDAPPANQKTHPGHTTTTRRGWTFHIDPQRNMQIMLASRDLLNSLDLVGDSQEMQILRNLQEEIDLIIVPLMNLFGVGVDPPSATLFFASLPKMIAKIAHDCHPRLLSGYLPFLQWLDEWRKRDCGIIEFLSHHIHSLNDQWIENFNSIVKSRTGSGKIMTFSQIETEVATAGYRREAEDELGLPRSQNNLLKDEFFIQISEDQQEQLKLVMNSTIDKMIKSNKWTENLNWKVVNKYEVGVLRMKNKLAEMEVETKSEKDLLTPHANIMSSLSPSNIIEVFSLSYQRLKAEIESEEKKFGEEDEEEEVDNGKNDATYFRVFSNNKQRRIMDILLFLRRNNLIADNPETLKKHIDDLGIKFAKIPRRRKVKKKRIEHSLSEAEESELGLKSKHQKYK